MKIKIKKYKKVKSTNDIALRLIKKLFRTNFDYKRKTD